MRRCKERAREYLKRGDITNAITSMLSDLGKHEETQAVGASLTAIGMLYVMTQDHDGAHRFIEGFTE